MKQQYIMTAEEVLHIDMAYNLAIDQACTILHEVQMRIVINADMPLTPAARVEAVLQIQKRIDRMQSYFRAV
jgi:2-phospho-L-lactate guanylyltransferase (CobY/MobA/RfbA family)